VVVTSRPPHRPMPRGAVPSRSPHPRRRGRRRRWPRLLARLLAVVVALLLALGAAGVVYLSTLPGVGDAEARVAGVLRPTRGSDTGLPVPPRVGRAVVAIEDERFYSHHGIDLVGMLRAAHVDLAHGSPLQGGSTITQQLAKALYVTDNHTPGAKLRMMGLAIKLELRYSKAEILEMYLNSIYYGDGQWGVAQASHTYVGRSPRALDWAQASLLAGLPQAPSAYDPTRHFTLAHARQRQVLDALVRTGALSPATADAAYVEVAVGTGGTGGHGS